MPEVQPEYNPTPMILEVDLPDFPDWAIMFTKIVPKVKFDQGYDESYLQQLNIMAKCKHWWNKIEPNHWKLYIEIFILVPNEDGDLLSTYLDLDLMVNIENNWIPSNISKE